MKFIGRLFGWLLSIGALAVLVHDGLGYLNTETFRFMAAGELWFRLDPPSLNLVQAIVQRYALPIVWDGGIVRMLQWPAAAVLAVPGLLLLRIARRRRGTRAG